MVTGTDEQATPIMVAADEECISPGELVDRNSAVIRDDRRRLGLSYDLFTRTTTPNHHRVVRDVFRTHSLRHHLTAAGPETQDTDFTWAGFVRRNNDERVARWGNFVNQTPGCRPRGARRAPGRNRSAGWRSRAGTRGTRGAAGTHAAGTA